MSREHISDERKAGIEARVTRILGPYHFVELTRGSYTMGGWWWRTENDEFIVMVEQHRSGDTFAISVGSKIRRKPRAHVRGPHTLYHLRGYVDGVKDHYIFRDSLEQLEWFETNVGKLLDTSFLNSDALNTWKVKASRRMFGQDSRN